MPYLERRTAVRINAAGYDERVVLENVPGCSRGFAHLEGRIDRKVILPSIAPIFVAVAVVHAAIRHQDLRPRGGADRRRPGIATTFPAIYVYDLMFQRGQIGQGAAAAIMMLLALAVVLVPYSLWLVWRRRRESGHG